MLFLVYSCLFTGLIIKKVIIKLIIMHFAISIKLNLLHCRIDDLVIDTVCQKLMSKCWTVGTDD